MKPFFFTLPLFLLITSFCIWPHPLQAATKECLDQSHCTHINANLTEYFRESNKFITSPCSKSMTLKDEARAGFIRGLAEHLALNHHTDCLNYRIKDLIAFVHENALLISSHFLVTFILSIRMAKLNQKDKKRWHSCLINIIRLNQHPPISRLPLSTIELFEKRLHVLILNENELLKRNNHYVSDNWHIGWLSTYLSYYKDLIAYSSDTGRKELTTKFKERFLALFNILKDRTNAALRATGESPVTKHVALNLRTFF